MFRRYQVNWTRFAQPDPYDGSYDLTDPQSFNRYSYVRNDPVNLVDPTGLDPQDPPPTIHIDPATGNPYAVPGISASVTIAFSQIFGAGSALGGDAHAQLLVIAMNLGGGGGGGPQNPAQTKQPDNRTDCQKLVDFATLIADISATRSGFLDEMARTFTAASNSSTSEMRRTANMAPRNNYGNTGFKPEFRINDTSNQVRHFVGGFIAGADIGYLPALVFMNRREEPNTNGQNNADIALNGVSTALGAGTIGQRMPYIRKNIVADFQKRLCE